jgi:TfoX/Sxy family transcriptional regulator of competence genes
MAYDEFLGERIANILRDRGVPFVEKHMFGGVAFMVDNKMCVGVIRENLMARIGTDVYEKAMEKKGCLPMEFTGRPMKGYVNVTPEGVDLDEDLEYWIVLALDFNPLAKSTKKKK